MQQEVAILLKKSAIAICIYPIPYFLVALVLQIVFAFVLGWFPIQTTLLTRGTFAQWLGSLLKASVLPDPCCRNGIASGRSCSQQDRKGTYAG